MAIIMGAPIAPPLLRRHEGCWLPRLMFSRVLFPALMEAGPGKQNAVVVIVVRRYARLVVVAKIGSPSSSIVTMIADPSSQAASVTVKYFYLSKEAAHHFS